MRRPQICPLVAWALLYCTLPSACICCSKAPERGSEQRRKDRGAAERLNCVRICAYLLSAGLARAAGTWRPVLLPPDEKQASHGPERQQRGAEGPSAGSSRSLRAHQDSYVPAELLPVPLNPQTFKPGPVTRSHESLAS